MKIAIVTATYPPYRGGIGSAAQGEAMALAALGHEVTVLTLARGAGAIAMEKMPGLRVERMSPTLAWGNAGWCPDLPERLKAQDVVILHYPFFGGAEPIGHWRAFSSGPKLVLRYDMDVRGQGWLKACFDLHRSYWLPLILGAADRVVVSSMDYAQTGDLAGRLKALGDRLMALPYGVDMERFRPIPGINRRNQLLFVGGLDHAHYFKGVDNLLMAVAPLLEEDSARRLVLVGNGERVEALRALCSQLGMASQVEFKTGCGDAELSRLYGESLVTVLPSTDRSESFGIVLAESLACGTPVLASNLPGIRVVFQDGTHGHLVGKGSSDAEPYVMAELAERLRWCLEHPAELAAMGARGPAWVQERFDWKAIVQAMVEGL